MAEYIERLAAISVACKGCNKQFPNEPCEPSDCDIQQGLFKIPAADVVEVVRCKECKDYSSIMFCDKPTHYGYCCNTHDSVLGGRHRFENDYCSFGAKMDGKGER